MNFLDEAHISVKAGNGGPGTVSFRREKFVEFGGPDGGNGGKGGDIIFIADSSYNTLYDFRFKRSFKAESGRAGGGKCKTGASGKNLEIRVPIGTVITSPDARFQYADLEEHGQSAVIAHGGTGGVGNHCFKSSTNQAPRQHTTGQMGEEFELLLQLKLFCDVGIIGLPNAGKSTLLSVLSAAKPKIASYPFTTLHPQLGVMQNQYDEVVIGDIPGIIEGASQGVGLGHRFLKHVEKCKLLLHLIDCTDEDIVESFQCINTELSNFSQHLAQKPRLVVLNKIEMCDDITKVITALEDAMQSSPTVLESAMTISAITNSGIENLKQYLFSIKNLEK